MAVSRFSTPEMFKQLQDAKTQVEEGLKEARIAEQAGNPQAASLVKQGEEQLKIINQHLSVYFPNGAPAA